MDSLKRNNNKTLYIDDQALSYLAYINSGLMKPAERLMSKEEALEVDKTKQFKGSSFPFSLLFAPAGKRNHEVLLSLKKGEVVSFVNNNAEVGEITIDDTFEINKKERLRNIYGTADFLHPGVKKTDERLGVISISGVCTVDYPLIQDNINRVKKMKMNINANFVSSMIISANPLNRAHERMIREAISNSDMLVIILRKPFDSKGLRYDIRYNALSKFVENFLPRNRVLIVPHEHTFSNTGFHELVLDGLLSKNLGCSQLIIGKNHAGLGLFYDKNKLNSVFDYAKDIGIHIKTIDEYAYCDTCRTLVSTQTCPHGQHHHTHYHSESIIKLIEAGLIPPTILVRKEVTANILAALFPERFENLQEIYYSMMPGTGLLEQTNEEQFYLKLIELYQTTSLT